MKMNIEELHLQLKECNKAIRCAEKTLRNAPEGTLVVSGTKENYKCYHRVNSYDRHGKYIPKNNMELITGLAQKAYANKLLDIASKRKNYLLKLLEFHETCDIKDVYYDFSEIRQSLISPLIMTDEDYANEWSSYKYEKFNKNSDENNEIITERGEIVRSKSEKILADKFFLKQIPYHYEKPLYQKGYGYIHPDFTLLDVNTRKEYYWEHFGMMDNPKYSEGAILKLETMAQNGIFVGDKLILTYETSTHPLNMKFVDELLKKYFPNNMR